MKYLFRLVGVFRCVIKTGPWQAFKLMVLAPKFERKYKIRVRGISRPISIRGKTSDAWVLNAIIICREYEGFIRNKPVRILDGGANIGLATLYWKRMYPEVEIVAVEPDDENFALLQENTSHLENVTLIHGGLWSKKTNLMVQYPDAEKYAIQVIEDVNGPIKATSISAIMKEHDWDGIDVIKLDVEGAEVEILMNNSECWISRINTLIVEIHQDIASDAAPVLFRAFADRKFHLAWRGENLILTQSQNQ